MSDNLSSRSPSIDYESVAEIDDDDEITICLKIKTVMSFKVKKSDCAKKLKEYGSLEGISENLMNVYMKDEFLHDEKTFEDYKITDNSQVSLVMDTMSEHVRKLRVCRIPYHPREQMEITANVADTVLLVKNLSLKMMIPGKPDNFDLMYDGKLLQDNETLASLNINNNACLWLVNREIIWIKVKTSAGKNVPLKVNRLQTVGYGMSMIQRMVSLENNESLFFNGEKLEEQKTFYQYNIKQNDVLKLACPLQVFIRLFGGFIFPLDVLTSDDVDDINRKLYKMLKLTVVINHSYTFNGKKLKSGRSIASYGITTDDTIMEQGSQAVPFRLPWLNGVF